MPQPSRITSNNANVGDENTIEAQSATGKAVKLAKITLLKAEKAVSLLTQEAAKKVAQEADAAFNLDMQKTEESANKATIRSRLVAL